MVRLNVTSKFGLGRKDCIVYRFNLPISKRIDTRDATLIYYLAGRLNKQSLTVEAELPCAHTCNIPHVLSKTKKNAKHLFQSWENLISDGAYVCYSD